MTEKHCKGSPNKRIYVCVYVTMYVCSLSCILQYYFFRCCWYFQIPTPSADNKRGGKLLSGPHRVTFVIATIIYFCSPPVFVAPRFWEPCDKLKPGLKQEREPWGRGCNRCMKKARLTTRSEVVLRSLAYTTPPSHWSFSNSSLFVHPP